MIAELLSLSVVLLFLVFLFRKKWQNLPPSPLSLPIIGHLHLLGPLIHHSFHNISSRYGPLIYLKLGSVSCVVASTPELAKQLLKTHELVFSSRKHSLAIDHLTYNSSFAFSPYGPYWKFIKKISTFELLGNRMINQFLPIRNKELQYFLGDLNSRTGQSINLTQELIKYSNNIISQMMLSMRSSDSDNDAEIARIVVREVTKIFGEFNVSDFIWFYRNFDLQGFRKRIDEIYTNYDGLLEKLITNREQQRKKMNKNISNGEEANKDFLDIMLDVMEDENAEIRLTRNHIKALFLDFFTAATDTTAITIEWALAELINNPKVLEKAREEINKVVGNERIVKESDNPNLHYIQAILKETFRLHPPIPMVSRKSVQDCKINGYTIPSNSLLFVNMWSIGRDPTYWKDPLEFKPERFLKSNNNNVDDEDNEFCDTSSIDIRGQHFQLLPFGTGRRSCPGISLAMQELPTTLGAMIQCFDWKIVNPPGVKINGGDSNVLDMTERPGLTAPRLHDLVLIPVPRMPHILDALSAT